LPGLLNQVISCHQCESGKYPIFYAHSGADDDLLKYSGFSGFKAHSVDGSISDW
jgi:hypothetical protein